MNYERIYAEFIADRRLKENKLSKYERHHIKPLCLNGSNDPSNLIKLSYADHFFAHILLSKIHGGLLSHVAWMMSDQKKYRGRVSRKRYAYLRSLWYDALTPERRAEIGNQSRERIANSKLAGTYIPPATGLRHSDSAKARIGKAASQNTKLQWSDPAKVEQSRQSNLKTWSREDKKQEHSLRMKQALSSSETRAKISENNRNTWSDPIVRERRIAGMREAAQKRLANKPPKPPKEPKLRQPVSEESRQRLRIAAQLRVAQGKKGGRKPGFKRTPEQIERLREYNRGSSPNEVTRAKMAEARRAWWENKRRSQ